MHAYIDRTNKVRTTCIYMEFPFQDQHCNGLSCCKHMCVCHLFDIVQLWACLFFFLTLLLSNLHVHVQYM